MDTMSVCSEQYGIIRLLGHGKGGYSYLAERNGKQYVLKQIHHEPCAYYNFGNNPWISWKRSGNAFDERRGDLYSRHFKSRMGGEPGTHQH